MTKIFKSYLIIYGLVITTHVQSTTQKIPNLVDEKKTAEAIVLNHAQDAIYFYKQQIEETRNKTNGINSLIKLNNSIIDNINKIKKENNILSIEQQIAQLKKQMTAIAINIYTKAIDHATNTNYFNKISSILSTIYNNALIQTNLNTIEQLELDVNQRIQKSVDSIRRMGMTIDLYSQNEQKQIEQLSSQLNALNLQLMSLRSSKNAETKLDPLEKQMQRYESLIADKILMQPLPMQNQIRAYKNAIKRYKLILQFIREPGTAARVSEDEIALFEQIAPSEN